MAWRWVCEGIGRFIPQNNIPVWSPKLESFLEAPFSIKVFQFKNWLTRHLSRFFWKFSQVADFLPKKCSTALQTAVYLNKIIIFFQGLYWIHFIWFISYWYSKSWNILTAYFCRTPPASVEDLKNLSKSVFVLKTDHNWDHSRTASKSRFTVKQGVL